MLYLLKALSLFSQYDLMAFVALHQDVRLRYASGFGASACRLEQVWFDLSALLLSSRSSAICGCPATSTEAKQLNSEVIPTKNSFASPLYVKAALCATSYGRDALRCQ